jgi:hypothetical protein
MFRRTIATACILTAAGILAATLTVTASPFNRATYFSFRTSVTLPGTVLPAGDYVFEIANPNGGGDVVLVRNKARSTLHLLALTRAVTRPRSDNLEAAIVLGEANRSEPRRISAWYAAGETTGRQFMY